MVVYSARVAYAGADSGGRLYTITQKFQFDTDPQCAVFMDHRYGNWICSDGFYDVTTSSIRFTDRDIEFVLTKPQLAASWLNAHRIHHAVPLTWSQFQDFILAILAGVYAGRADRFESVDFEFDFDEFDFVEELRF